MGETVEETKRKRGRPSKGAEEKVAKKDTKESEDEAEEVEESAPKRGRGRPKGIKKKKPLKASLYL